MIEIDGSEGEGGGQIVRSSLALSVFTGQTIRIRYVRANRDKPGLRRQHMTAVKAAAAICGATVQGDHVGSSSVTFEPGKLKPGEFHFDIGSAGSTMLVLQTILPPLLLADAPSRIVLEGGTHNIGAPPFDFLAKTYLPIVQRLGPQIDATLESPGFYPQGGGRVVVNIQPASQLKGLSLINRGWIISQQVRAIIANLPDHIAQRERNWIADKSGWPAESCRIERWDHARGPGNIVLIEIESEQLTEVFSAFGQKGVRAEKVAESVWLEADEYLKTEAPVGPHLADQLMLPFGIAAHHGSASEYRTLPLTLHALTHAQILERFLDIHCELTPLDDGTVRVSLLPKKG